VINLIGLCWGWISRIYLGEKPYFGRGDLAPVGPWQAHTYVATLVTLGTPHISQERWTRWNLDFVNNNYPGAFYRNIRYICVAERPSSGTTSRQVVGIQQLQTDLRTR